MAYFALYYIPPADSPFYQRGSQILGYDVRAGEYLPVENDARQRLPQFDNAWVADSQEFGLHVTIGDAIAFDAARTGEIAAEVETVLNCFDPARPFTLTQAAQPVFYHDVPHLGQTAALLHYDANDALRQFHAVVAAYLHRLGDGSYYTQLPPEALAQHFADAPFRVHRVRHFYSPTVFDSFRPHFTLLSPYPIHAEREAMTAALIDLFGGTREFEVESVCLLVKHDGSPRYELVREFHRQDYPQPL